MLGILGILSRSTNDDRLKECSKDVQEFDAITDKIGVNIEKLSLKEISVILSNTKTLETEILRRLIQEAKKKESKED